MCSCDSEVEIFVIIMLLLFLIKCFIFERVGGGFKVLVLVWFFIINCFCYCRFFRRVIVGIERGEEKEVGGNYVWIV